LGIAGRGFTDRPSFLFSSDAPDWTYVAIHMTSSEGYLIFGSGEDKTNEGRVPVVSDYYWAADILSISIGGSKIDRQNVVVIFDTGSNYFGVSRGILRSLITKIQDKECRDELMLQMTDSVHVSFAPEVYTRNGQCDDLAISEIDQSRFGDLASREVIIVGTRGLRGKTLIINRDSSKKDSFYILVN
jgi:hypothetical protein